MRPRFTRHNSPDLTFLKSGHFTQSAERLVFRVFPSHGQHLSFRDLGAGRVFPISAARRDSTEMPRRGTRNVFPRTVLPDQANNTIANRVIATDAFRGFSGSQALNNLSYLFNRQFGRWIILTYKQQAVLACVLGVSLVRSVLKIFQSVISLVCVFMVDEHSARAWTNKRCRHQLVNTPRSGFGPLALQRHTQIGRISSGVAFEYRDFNTSYAPDIRRLVSRITRNVAPLFGFEFFFGKVLISHRFGLWLGSFREANLCASRFAF